MPRKSASKDEVEVVFGFKQVLGTAVLAIILLGCAYLMGYERGHARASQGKPSLLAVLEGNSEVPAEELAVPLSPREPVGGRPGPAPTAESTEVPDPTAKPAAEVPGEPRTDRQAIKRAKPTPGIKQGTPSVKVPAPQGHAPAAPPSQPRRADPVRPAAGVGQAGDLHYQVAAMSRRTNAKELVDWLRTEGFPARILPASSNGLFRVVVGPFKDDQDARLARDRLGKHGFQLMTRRF